MCLLVPCLNSSLDAKMQNTVLLVICLHLSLVTKTENVMPSLVNKYSPFLRGSHPGLNTLEVKVGHSTTKEYKGV